jgi:gamma-F420-2:alpha-L-glutamate ligase
MGLRLVYGLKTNDSGYLDQFFPSRRLAEAARLLGLDYAAMVFGPDATIATMVDTCRGHTALLRGELPQGLYDSMEAAGIMTVNGADATRLARDKYLSAQFFASIAVPHPGTGLLDHIASKALVDFPFVVKPRFGKMGRGVVPIESEADWLALVDSGVLADGEYLAQDMVVASRGMDIRFFFAGFDTGLTTDRPTAHPSMPGIASIAVMRKAPGFASNAHAGGTMERYDPPPGLRAEAERIFELSGMRYGTVDFLLANTQRTAFSVCEMNSCPGFEEFERATGIDVALAILKAAMANTSR